LKSLTAARRELYRRIRSLEGGAGIHRKTSDYLLGGALALAWMLEDPTAAGRASSAWAKREGEKNGKPKVA
jgi:hypothetical protein